MQLFENSHLSFKVIQDLMKIETTLSRIASCCACVSPKTRTSAIWKVVENIKPLSLKILRSGENTEWQSIKAVSTDWSYEYSE